MSKRNKIITDDLLNNKYISSKKRLEKMDYKSDPHYSEVQKVCKEAKNEIRSRKYKNIENLKNDDEKRE